MKTNILSFTVLAALLAVGCSKTEVQPQTWRTDPDAVIVDASVGAMTKSNPLGDDESFNIGDEITIMQPDVGTSVVYKFDGTSWSPVGGDYLVWSDKGKTFRAWYPAKDPSFVIDQSTNEGIAKADAMYSETGYINIPSDHRLKTTLFRRRALVTVKIKGYNDEYDPAKDKITDVRIYLTDASRNADQAVKPYVRDAAGVAQTSDAAGTVGFSYSAIGLRADDSDSNLFIEFKVGEKTLTVKGCPGLVAGYAYTFNLTVGKACIEAGDVTVSDWSDPVDLNDGNEFEADVDVNVWDGTVATGFSAGSGTADDPFVIATGAELAFLATSVNDPVPNNFRTAHFKLATNIDLNNIDWTPIGYTEPSTSVPDTYVGQSFGGHFDGNGHLVYNLKVNVTDEKSAGLFGAASGASIKNLKISKASVTGRDKAGILVGCVWGSSTSPTSIVISGCEVSGTVDGVEDCGGLVGYINYGEVSDCQVSASVNGNGRNGALAGFSFESKFKDCTTSGSVTGSYCVGGFVGYIWSGSEATGCTANADVSASDWRCGGFAGCSEENVTFADCSAFGVVSTSMSSNCKLGGFIGEMFSSTTARNCRFGGSIVAPAKADGVYVGAFIGYDNDGGKTVGCSYDGTKVSGYDSVGYIADETSSEHEIGSV